jgi:hypothetical protein
VWTALAGGPATAQEGPRSLDASGGITYFIADAPEGSGGEVAYGTLARWAVEAWAALADPALEMVPGPEATATIRVYWVRADGGLYGQARPRLVDGRVGADVFVGLGAEGLGADIAERAAADPLFRDTIVYLTCVHEIGHAFGLPHTSDLADIMYSFQYGGDLVAYFDRFRERLDRPQDIRNTSPFSDADRRAFRLRYP